ncbi:unnamed protein product, partial [Durusdinium trenchii]
VSCHFRQLSFVIADLQAMMGEMQLLMLAGWLQRKRGTSGCSGGWFQTIIGTLHYLKCI